MGSKKEIKNDVEGHPSGSRPESVPEQLSPPIPPPQLLPSSAPPAGKSFHLHLNCTLR